MKKKHKCQEGITCRCSSTACEPNDDCPLHGYPFPPRCEICGRYMKWPKSMKGKIDKHLGCPSWPNCDIDPNGCLHLHSFEDVEWYGHRG